MDIVLLCAGTSSRMGKTNKLLLPFNDTTMVANSAMQALKYLETQASSSTLIIVTGYQHFSIEKALKECKTYVANSSSKLSLIIIYNKDYKLGQFTSVQTGVKQVSEGSDFFISLADMPQITADHYQQIKLNGHDAARAYYNDIPGHPVLLSSKLKETILKSRKNNKVNTILQSRKVNKIEITDPSWIHDIDTPEDARCLK